MSTKYPSQIDGQTQLPLTIDLVTPVRAEVVNNIRGAVIAIEAELGADPSREFGTVRARIDALEARVTALELRETSGLRSVLDEGIVVSSDVSEMNFIGTAVTAIASGTPGRVDVFVSGGTSGSIFQVQESIIVTSGGQTSFVLSQIPQDATAVEMFVNGLKQEYSSNYTVIGSTVTYTGPPSLITTDDVEFWYISIASSTIGQVQESIAITFLGQTSIVLSSAPVDVDAVKMYVNGQKQQEGADYNVTGTTVTYTGPITLDTTDDVEFWYITSGVSAGGGGGNQTLSETLLNGNVTDGYDIIMSNGDAITGASGTVTIDDDLFVTGDGYISGKLTVLGLIDPTGLVLDEQVTGFGPATTSACKGVVWVRDDTPNNLLFTDDVGTDFVLNVAGGGEALDATLVLGNTTGGTDISMTDGDAIVASDGHLDLNVESTGANSPLIRFQEDGLDFLTFDPNASVEMLFAASSGNITISQADQSLIDGYNITIKAQSSTFSDGYGGNIIIASGGGAALGGSGFGNIQFNLGSQQFIEAGVLDISSPIPFDSELGAPGLTIGLYINDNLGAPFNFGFKDELSGDPGDNLNIFAQSSDQGNGGNLVLSAGSSIGLGGDGGNLNLFSGFGSGDAGSVHITAESGTAGDDGYITLNLRTGGAGETGAIDFQLDGYSFLEFDPSASVNMTFGGDAGDVTFSQGITAGPGSSFNIFAQSSVAGPGGDIGVTSGAGTTGSGDVNIIALETTATGPTTVGDINLILGTDDGGGAIGTVSVKGGDTSSPTDFFDTGFFSPIPATSSLLTFPFFGSYFAGGFGVDFGFGMADLPSGPAVDFIINGQTSLDDSGGGLTLLAGQGDGASGGNITIASGPGIGSGGVGGDIQFLSGAGDTGGDFLFQGSDADAGGDGSGGNFIFIAGAGDGTGIGGSYTLTTGDGYDADGGNCTITLGDCTNGSSEGGSFVFTAGDAISNNGGNFLVTTGTSANGGQGGDIIFTLGACGDGETNNGGEFLVTAGANSGGTDTDGGAITLTSGLATVVGDAGIISFVGGVCSSGTGDGGFINLTGGDSMGLAGNAGAITLIGGENTATASGDGGHITLTAGDNSSITGDAGSILMTAGSYLIDGYGNAGSITLTAGNSSDPDGYGGDVTITPGTSTTEGIIILDGVTTLKSYTVATLPDQVVGGMIFVTDETGGAVPAFSDGTDWLRVTDRVAVT